ncbi:MAG: glycosyltransferase family 4 protein [Actinobacteria bacterium]|nr:glycosyltransferase family 4 protein [Actinomycetota bacterium]
MRIAIVHDYLNQYGGAERVIEVFNELFPNAPIFTSIYNEEKLPAIFRQMNIKTSFMQRFPFLDRHFKKYLLFYPKAIESFDLSDYDLVLSSSSAFAKGAIKDKDACHICYCYTPMRFVWDYIRYVEKENFGKLTQNILPLVIKKLKKWDIATIDRVDYYIAISAYIRDRIKRCYERDAEVIHPPVNVKSFTVSNKAEDYFLIVSRLNAYKNIDLVIDAFNDLGLNLKIVGSGPYKETLMKMVKRKNIEFLGRLDETDLKEIYSKCRAYIFPGKEDFGITPVEAQASGRPVIAYADGGALETVLDKVTGLFFKENTKDAFTEIVKKFLRVEDRFNRNIIRENALRFDREIFKEKIMDFINQKYYSCKNKAT